MTRQEEHKCVADRLNAAIFSGRDSSHKVIDRQINGPKSRTVAHSTCSKRSAMMVHYMPGTKSCDASCKRHTNGGYFLPLAVNATDLSTGIGDARSCVKAHIGLASRYFSYTCG